MLITSYDAKDCVIQVGDTYITGVGEDMITFEKEEAYFEPKVGAQGDTIKSMINNPVHTITLTIQSTSPQKAYLLNLLGQRENFPVWVQNYHLAERFGGTQCAITEMPSVSRGVEADDLEFNITVFDGKLENWDAWA